ncbi:MAG TPA: DUF6491 family protein [Azospirillaceae bacterium]|nr:DUF6491 family protein [Azospirillaceae bacterium]
MKRLPIVSLVAVLAAAAPALAQDTPTAKAGEEFCIDTSRIRQTTVIDAKTILVEMKGRKDWYRIDLVNRCPGLRTDGFSYETSINRLCKTDPLRTVDTPVPATCLISRIAKSDQAEAERLKDSRRKGRDTAATEPAPTPR